jgi:hypothetical protein
MGVVSEKKSDPDIDNPTFAPRRICVVDVRSFSLIRSTRIRARRASVGVQARKTGQLANGFVQIMGCPKSLEASGDTYFQRTDTDQTGEVSLDLVRQLEHSPRNGAHPYERQQRQTSSEAVYPTPRGVARRSSGLYPIPRRMTARTRGLSRARRQSALKRAHGRCQCFGRGSTLE